MKYFYGPVFSRRLGFSLGVDVLPRKICTFECMYCQVGNTVRKTVRRFSYVNTEEFKKELEAILQSKVKIDYITISGRGEPTLHKNLDKIIKTIKVVSKNRYPVCVITNSSLLYRRDVRNELSAADLVIPSLDAPNQEIFKKICHPYKTISFHKVMSGLINFRREYKGSLWLEIMLIKDVNDREKYAYEFKRIVDKLYPHKVHLNIPVRITPLTKKNLIPSQEAVEYFRKILGEICEVVVSQRNSCVDGRKDVEETLLLESLKRRPQSIRELAFSLGISLKTAGEYIQKFIKQGRLTSIKKGKEKQFFIEE